MAYGVFTCEDPSPLFLSCSMLLLFSLHLLSILYFYDFYAVLPSNFGVPYFSTLYVSFYCSSGPHLTEQCSSFSASGEKIGFILIPSSPLAFCFINLLMYYFWSKFYCSFFRYSYIYFRRKIKVKRYFIGEEAVSNICNFHCSHV